MTECIECGTSIDLANRQPGEIIDCPDCGTQLEVVENNLIMLWNSIVDVTHCSCSMMRLTWRYYKLVLCRQGSQEV